MYKQRREELAPEIDLYRQAFGERVRKLRKAKGWGQDEFAFRAGLHRNHVGAIENNHLDPQLSTLYKVAKGLEMELHELLRLEDEVS